VRYEQKAHLVAAAAGARVGRVVELTLSKPPGGGNALDRPRDGAATGVSLRSAYGFQPRPAKPRQLSTAEPAHEERPGRNGNLDQCNGFAAPLPIRL
jgi:hypothetical protein